MLEYLCFLAFYKIMNNYYFFTPFSKVAVMAAVVGGVIAVIEGGGFYKE